MEVCRFMTNRENVGFDEVHLYQSNDETGRLSLFADGFLDYQYDNFTEKKYQQNIFCVCHRQELRLCSLPSLIADRIA